MCDYSPLLPPGFYTYSLDQLKEITVDQFTESPNREKLFQSMVHVIEDIMSFAVVSEIWIDGSFLTKKVAPGDVDMLFVIDSAWYISLSKNEQYNIANFFYNRDINKIRTQCDILSARSDDIDTLMHYKGCFGFSREDKPKGIVKVRLDS